MEVKEEKLMEEEQRVAEKTIPVFTVLKNGAILKNIFVVNSRDFSSPERNGSAVSDDDDEVEEILVVGRHPDCDILLTHPSISRFHLEIRSISSRQRLFVTDLSSVHGTWVRDQRVAPHVCVEVEEGDTIRIGGSTRIYMLHWIPLSRAYDFDNPFVSPLDASAVMEQENENRMIEPENLEAEQDQSLVNIGSSDYGDLHLDVTSEGTGSSVPSEDEDTYVTAREMSLPLASPSVLTLAGDSVESQELQFKEDLQNSTKWNLDVVEASEDKASSSCSPSKQQRGGYVEGLGCLEHFVAAEVDECDVRGDGSFHLNVISERMESSVLNEEVQEDDSYPAATEIILLPLLTNYIAAGRLQLTEDVQASPVLEINNLEANVENTSSCLSPSKGQNDGCYEASGCSAFELVPEVGILSIQREVSEETVFVKKEVIEVSAEPFTKADIWSHEENGETEVSRQVIAVSPNCFSQAEATLGILTDQVRSLLDTAFQSEVSVESESENLLHQKSDGEAQADIQNYKENGENEVSRQVITVSPNSFSQAEPTLEILTEEAQGLEVQSELAIETDSENVLHNTSNGETKVGSRQVNALSGCVFAGNELLLRNNTEDIQSLCSSWQPMPENESGTLSYLSTPNQKPKTELSIGSGRSEKYYSLSELEGEDNTDKWCPISSTLAEETFEDAKTTEEPPSVDTGSQENQTLNIDAVKDDALSEMDSSSAGNIWSRRGKAASVLQIRTNKSEGKKKQIGRQPKDKLHRKQALSDKSISLTVHHGAENLEPEIFTPDKENLTPSSHMLKRLQDIGDVKDSKSSSKLSGKSCSPLVHSSIAISASEAFKEPEIFTPDKENLTPTSHMLKRLREFGDIKGTKGSSSKASRKPFFGIHLEANVMAEQKPEDLQSITSKSKEKHEPVALKKKAERAPFQPLLEKPSSQSQSYTEASSPASAMNNISRGIRSSSMLSDGQSKKKWTIVLDTSSLLDKDSKKPLHLLQGLKGTHLVVPRTVLRELNEVKCSRSLLFRRRTEIASSALDWIEECKVNSKWWIQVQSPSEETKATAPTPPVTPQSLAFPFSLHWNNYAPEIDSPTSEDQVLECALFYRNRNPDEKLVLLSNDATLKIKAMAEGVICETPLEFYESLVNPFSERFMWTESTARGRTWTHLDDFVLRERYNNRACKKKSTNNGGGRGESSAAAKGLKLILLHNSHYGHTH
ncbi:hypothetical protein CARUB_v10008117mg [Capsella rubella]|uniref:FHA domain-containing protein n=1 Tax=Capsella rubella TaxID=81985 RepID=R0IQL7_9BRAS|nr:hypothetical protein CARUB_v10008117mg [Capsella rubella]